MPIEGESQISHSKKNKKHKHKEFEVDSEVQEIKVKKAKNKKYKKEVNFEEESAEINHDFEERVAEFEEQEEKVIPEDSPAPEAEWPKDHIFELITKMEEQIPEKDNLRYTSRVEKIDWSKVQFGSYSAEDCCNKWKFISKKIRSYRLLQEVIKDAKEWAEKPWSNFYGRGKKGKHPDQPNRPLSSYMLFYMKKKNKIAKSNPNLKMTDISKIIGEKYNALPQNKKNSYVNLAKKMQEEYKVAMDNFYLKHPEAAPQPTQNHKKGSKEIHGLHKPLTPFKLFYNEKFKKHQNDRNFDKNAFLEKCKEQWHSLSTKKKAIWIKWALEAEIKYLEELSAYSSAREEPLPAYKSVITKDEKAILDRVAGKPEKPPNSAYSLFSRLMLKSEDMKHRNEPPRNRMQEIARQWKLVPPEEKQKYADQVQHMIEAYKLDFATYLESLPEDKRAEELAKNVPKRKLNVKPLKKSKKSLDKPKTEFESSISTKLYKGEPKKPPVTIFEYFIQQFKKENPQLPEATIAVKAAAQFKTLTETDKEKYQKKLEQAKRKYMLEYEEFLKTLNEEELKQYSLFKNARTHNISSDEESSSEDEEDSESDSSDSEEDDDSDS